DVRTTGDDGFAAYVRTTGNVGFAVYQSHRCAVQLQAIALHNDETGLKPYFAPLRQALTDDSLAERY
ncbi:MAG: hypothetical protein HYY28_03340, partial [Betaproteobacteria bacterium]|nr:hypothetical protein [Betaproteobacteria bacterium]